jgi:hypothetical protein
VQTLALDDVGKDVVVVERGRAGRLTGGAERVDGTRIKEETREDVMRARKIRQTEAGRIEAIAVGIRGL